MERRRLGAGGPEVSALGLGCMSFSGAYGEADEAEGVATVRRALDSGVNLLDTGDFYGMGRNELTIREALRGRRREDVVLSVKFGALRGPDGAFVGIDARPQAIKNFLAYSLVRLGTDHVDIYRPGRLDPAVPIEETVGAIAELIQAGYVRQVGLSEVGAETLRRAQKVHPVADLQIEYSLFSRGPEAEILPTCRKLGIGVTAYGVLSRGLLSGRWTRERSGSGSAPGDFRSHSPRFVGENLDRNLELVEALRQVADGLGASLPQVAVAWVLSRGPEIVPVVGARRPEQLDGLLGAASLNLSAETLAAIERAIPADSVSGTRYPAQFMAGLDSERPSSGEAKARP